MSKLGETTTFDAFKKLDETDPPDEVDLKIRDSLVRHIAAMAGCKLIIKNHLYTLVDPATDFVLVGPDADIWTVKEHTGL